ncbi:hypothetical protein EDC01DRAFT_236466 [Geopyxis carbonaria]|nr:hypothetical protein EDC01DRAFT_236466 [Geopyxis carbonaria]
MQIKLCAPADVAVKLKFREGMRNAPFSWAYLHETQLDYELEGRIDGHCGLYGLSGFATRGGPVGSQPSTIDPYVTKRELTVVDTAVVVKGKLYVDDRVFWEDVLEEGETYQVAYNSGIPRSYFTKIMDYIRSTPLYDSKDIPQPDYGYTSSRMRDVLMQHGFLTQGNFQLRLYSTGHPWVDETYESWWSENKRRVYLILKKSRGFNSDRDTWTEKDW